MGGWQKIGAAISVLWLIGSPIYLLLIENKPAEKSYAACIEESLVTSARMRKVGQHDQADAWEHHSYDWCWQAAGYTSPVSLAHAFVEGNHSVVLWAFLLAPIALLWLIGSLAIATLRRTGRGLHSIE
jgi:hypothetical protein